MDECSGKQRIVREEEGTELNGKAGRYGGNHIFLHDHAVLVVFPRL